jgi:hypothetical protein
MLVAGFPATQTPNSKDSWNKSAGAEMRRASEKQLESTRAACGF